MVGVAGWRWLDLRAFASTLVSERPASWKQARVIQVTYCTARISARDDASGARDQDVYPKALLSWVLTRGYTPCVYNPCRLVAARSR